MRNVNPFARITLGITGPLRLMLQLKTRYRRLRAHAIVMRRAGTRVQTTTDSPDSTALDASQSNRTITNSLTKYQACPYERRLVAMPPSIIHAQCQSLRTHNVCNHRAATSDCPFENAWLRGSGSLCGYAASLQQNTDNDRLP